MRVRAVGRYLLVRTSFDLIDAIEQKSTIAFPQETIDKLKGGMQVHTILSAGPSAFDDAAAVEQSFNWIGRRVMTSRYPGHAVDLDPLATDAEVASVRMISCDEVHAIIAEGEEDGADV